ncbi:Hypothetical protein ADU72_1221 [Pediococcus damnosus]|uniref:Uncharacterized protein n=1 Tax=Pediococcus damnosus TaxID=51663 RepID=A0ABM6A4F6_9LACO|nr:hypothetical protein [Pediococcus damnosus]AMV67154.1 Hypothetical protein ADU72_1221 [Pediococcus damnosus]KJU74843.1 hypothetical protein AH70_04545 [Pediococcus damnosus LMG 28219]KRN53742.1 hypothetical protein IV84_GL001752 [Pediococcus damnosus]PIO81067.1 hypothetical protein BSQ38_05095 [Pediococcus damnosus]PIO85444.1 hypothetical protein BSQ37_05615 [Pediococcus damnosus]
MKKVIRWFLEYLPQGLALILLDYIFNLVKYVSGSRWIALIVGFLILIPLLILAEKISSFLVSLVK